MRRIGKLLTSYDAWLALGVAVLAAVAIWTTWFVCHGFFMGAEQPE